MATQPIQTSEVGDIFKSLVWGAVIEAAKQALIKVLPFLALGPMPVILSFVLGIVGDAIYDALKGVYNFQSIGIKNEIHRREFDDASVKLKLIARDFGVDSPEFKAERKKHAEALAQFVRFSVPS